MTTRNDARSEPSSAPAGTSPLELRHDYFDELPELCLEWQAASVPAPELVAVNEGLAEQLGIDFDELTSTDGVGVLAGNLVPESAKPVALGYAGHQFGNYSPRLGDGRALLLGELVDPGGQLLDLHLKGSGRTPFARGGDGKATIGPMLREYVVSEALHSFGVPTTRSLAVVSTGERIARNRAEPGAVLARIAASHIRVGTFEYAVRLGGDELVRRLADHAIRRHHPAAAVADNPYRQLLASVIDAQAELVARWMLLGFIHGVMNTDNMTISGEGIDYGPCAFMDRYDPASVFSSIDHAGRYGYGNQAPIAVWNLARLAETMIGLLDAESDAAVEVATELVNSFPERFNIHWREGMALKLGLQGPPIDDPSLFDDLPVAMHSDNLDWTLTFRRLAEGLRSSDGHLTGTASGADSEQSEEWVARWCRQVDLEGRGRDAVAKSMDSVNPIYIPRNHILDEALEAATVGEIGPFRTLVDVLSDPFTERPGLERFAEPAPAEFNERFRTFCGT